MTNSTQLSLDRPEWFRPVPEGVGHYVPALQALKGERTALANASSETWSRVTPFVLVRPGRKPKGEVFKGQSVSNWMKELARAVGTHPIFLGVLRMNPAQATDRGQPVLALIHEQARKRHMTFVPVLTIGDSNATVAVIRETVAADGRGVGVRYRLFGTASPDGRSPQTLVKDALAAVELEPDCADLLIDVGHISADVDVEPTDVVASIDELAAVGNWRSIVLLGTAMERSLGGGIVPEGTIGRLPRREWELWSAVREANPSRLPTYGDYAVQHPEPPAEGGGGPMRANVRYTLDEVTLIPRGRGPIYEEGPEQYRDLCQQIVDDPDFAGAHYTWGDRLIHDCAEGGGDPGSQTTWRGAGTSHHLRHVVDQLARLT